MALASFGGMSIDDALASEVKQLASLFVEDVELSFHSFEKGHVVFSVDKVNGIVPGHKLLMTWDDDNQPFAAGTAGLVEGRVNVYDFGDTAHPAVNQFVEVHALDNYVGVRKLSLAEMLAKAYEHEQRTVDRAVAREAARQLADEALGVAIPLEVLREQIELYKGDVVAYANEITRYAFVKEMDFERACVVIGYEPGMTTDSDEVMIEHCKKAAEKAIALETQAQAIERARTAWRHGPWLVKGGAAEKAHCIELSSPGLCFAELPMSGRVTVYCVTTMFKDWYHYSETYVAVDSNSGRSLVESLDLVKACVEELYPDEELVKRGLDKPLYDEDYSIIGPVGMDKENLNLYCFAEEFAEWGVKFEVQQQELFEQLVDAISDPALDSVWQLDETWKSSFECERELGWEFFNNPDKLQGAKDRAAALNAACGEHGDDGCGDDAR